jgi:hypothetical protein
LNNHTLLIVRFFSFIFMYNITISKQLYKVTILTLIGLLFMMTINRNLPLLNVFSILSQRLVSLSLVVIYTLTLTYYVYKEKWLLKYKVYNFLKTYIVNILILIFYTTIDNKLLLTLNIFDMDINIHTGWSIFPLLVIIFWKHYYVFVNPFGKQFLLNIEVFTINLLFFSLISLFQVDRTSLRNFDNNILAPIINQNSILFFICNISVITILLLIEISQYKIKNFFLWFLLISLILFEFSSFIGIESISLVQNTNHTYWHKALYITIVWSFIYQNARRLLKNDDRQIYLSKLIFSNSYHLFLFIIIIIFT